MVKFAHSFVITKIILAKVNYTKWPFRNSSSCREAPNVVFASLRPHINFNQWCPLFYDAPRTYATYVTHIFFDF